MFHPLCGYSLQKGAKAIAIIDLVVLCVIIISHGIAYEYMRTEYEYDYEHELSLNDSYLMAAAEQPKSLWNIINATEYGENIPFETTFAPHDISQYMNSQEHASGSYWGLGLLIFLGILALAICIGYIFLEVWLCRLLLRASKNRDSSACKTWFWWRLAITIIILLGSVTSMATLKHDWVDWFLEPIDLYRIYALITVNEFRKEIAATSGRLKLRV